LADGTVRTVGRNDFGQLGINVSGGTRQTPVQVFGISSSAVAIAGGSYYTSVLLADGSVRTFGQNDFGQLGTGDTASRLTPVQVVTGFSSVRGKVAGGGYHTAVVMSDGTVRTFGRNDFGQLGLGDTVTRLTPVQVFGISSSAVAIAGGARHTAVLLADGTVRTFGFNNFGGALGVNDKTNRLTPVQVFGISSSATAVACGYYHTAVLLADGTVRTFGRGAAGQLGINDGTDRSTPVQVFGISSSATALACGWYFTAVLLADGTVRTFGQNGNGQLGVNDVANRLTPVTVLNITSATAVAGGRDHTAILLADGTVRTFGVNDQGQLGINVAGGSRLTPVQVLNITSATAVACGWYFTAVLLANGTVRAFGANNNGGLGVGDTTSRQTPVQVFGISSSATAIAGGAYHTSVLLADGTLRTVGQNTNGQLGVADKVSRLIPVKVGVSGNKVACGYYHTAVLSNDGTVRTFGRNNNGQLGVNDTTQRLTPVQVTIFTSATAVACGSYQTAVLLADGTVRTVGNNAQGQLGINVAGGSRQTPVTVLNITSATAVAGGVFHMAVLLANGTVGTFGFNDSGQLGINIAGGSRQTPVTVLNITSATAVACGTYHTVVPISDGTVRSFGINFYGNLGINVSGGSRQTPVQVLNITSATSVACVSNHTIVLLADGTVRMFGTNFYGELGVNDTTSRQTPVQVFGISSSATAVACGQNHTAVLLADGTVKTFGRNNRGQLGVNDTTNRLTPVTVLNITSATAVAGGYYYTAILLQDGTVRTFGSNTNGQLGVNDTTSRLTPVQVIAAGAVNNGKIGCGMNTTIIILKDGTVRITGANDYGQLGVNDNLSRLTPVTVTGITNAVVCAGGGYTHTAIVLTDGKVMTFGNNNKGQLGIGVTGGTRQTPVQVSGITSATAVSCGIYSTVVLLSDGTVRTFGYNNAGQLGLNDTTDRNAPVQVWGISSSATAVASGYYYTVILLSNGTVRAIGRNRWGELGNGSGGIGQSSLTPVQVLNITSATAVTCGFAFGAVVLADGTVRTFGNNDNGNLGVNDTTSRNTPVPVLNITNATQVAAGTDYTIMLLSDGKVSTVGRGYGGALGVGDSQTRQTPVIVLNITSAVAIAACGAGGSHTATLLSDGTIRTFGYNFNGQLGVNDTIDRSTPVQVTGVTSVASSATFLTNATAIVIALSSASTPVVSGFLLSTAAIITYPFVQFPALNLGPVTTPLYQLELTTDYARKLTTSTWTIGSDERLKTDIETANVDRCVEIVQNLDLKYFKWEFPNDSETGPDKHSLGWIAQEFAQFFPRSVETAPAHGIMDFKNLNSDQIIKVMWGALKKLRADLKSQKSSDSELSTVGDNALPTPE
jgi:alpha-tubulin suppressor-like RCC1 family protein